MSIKGLNAFYLTYLNIYANELEDITGNTLMMNSTLILHQHKGVLVFHSCSSWNP